MTTLLRCSAAVALLAIFSMKSNAAPGEALDDQHIYTICAAAQGILASRMDGVFGEMMLAEAQRFVAKIEDRSQIEGAMRGIQRAYNAGEFTWEQLVDLAEQCSEVP